MTKEIYQIQIFDGDEFTGHVCNRKFFAAGLGMDKGFSSAINAEKAIGQKLCEVYKREGKQLLIKKVVKDAI